MLVVINDIESVLKEWHSASQNLPADVQSAAVEGSEAPINQVTKTSTNLADGLSQFSKIFSKMDVKFSE